MQPEEQLKRCTKCGLTKPLNQFVKHKNRPDGFDYNCKTCHNAARRDEYKHNRNRNRESMFKYKYGINWNDYRRMWIQQKGCCAICGIYQSELKRALCVDHNHKTGQVRGLLCNKCNKGIGIFNDDTTILQAAIKYINN